jgi:hypothetical protein
MHGINSEKSSQKWGYFCHFPKQLPKVNDHMLCENSPNLATQLLCFRNGALIG